MPSFRERYPPPWRVEETPSGYRVVCSTGVDLLYVYAEDVDRRHANSRPKLTWPEARALAEKIAALPNS